MDILRIGIAAVAVWRITHLLQAEDGPFDILEHLRHGVRRIGLAGLADCFYCLSLWIAAPAAVVLASYWKDRMLLWPALSGVAIFLNRLAEREAHTAAYSEEPYTEENSPCPAAEMQNGTWPDNPSFTPALSLQTTRSSAPHFSGTPGAQVCPRWEL